MVRTVIDLDEEMFAKAQRLTGLRKKVEVVNSVLKKQWSRRRSKSFSISKERYRGRETWRKRGKIDMVVVDTSVWIDFFRIPAAEGNGKLEELIRDNNRTAICGLIIQEILQGIGDRKIFELTRQRLLFLPYLEAPREVHLLAAALYVTCGKKECLCRPPMRLSPPWPSTMGFRFLPATCIFLKSPVVRN